MAARIVAPRPNITAGRTQFVYTRPMTGLPQGDSPALLNASYTITADIEVPQGGAEGMILTSGGRFPATASTCSRASRCSCGTSSTSTRQVGGPDALPPGRHTVEFDFKYEGIGAGTLAFNNFSGLGRPGTGTLKVDGKVVDTKRWRDAADDPAVGRELRHRLRHADRRERCRLQPPFPLTAKLNKLTSRSIARS